MIVMSSKFRTGNLLFVIARMLLFGSYLSHSFCEHSICQLFTYENSFYMLNLFLFLGVTTYFVPLW